ncbi:MAG TPA: hypothetical protein VFL86_15805 [Burkholderiaceae bacterium]|nr:hypothetical protein [Burkholderiaceae bacterium]
MSDHRSTEIAATAARLIVEEGLEYGPAKRRAVRQLGLDGQRGAALPSNEEVEAQVCDYLALFRADTQPRELALLRDIAALWMQRLAEFHPLLTGAVWRGTATRLSNVHLQLFCDDSKAPEIALINQGLSYDVGSAAGPHGRQVDVLSVGHVSRELGEPVNVCLWVLDTDDVRGLRKPDAGGRTDRGDLAALRRLMANAAQPGAGP